MWKRLYGIAADRRGNIALMGSILSVPLVLSIGMVVDLTNINRIKSELQQSVDAAVLSVAREGSGVSNDEARAIATRFLAGNLDSRQTSVHVVRDEGTIRLRAETRATLAFGSLFGYDNLPIVAAASADTAFASYEIALVLDTTGSMAGGKLVAMKDAVLGLIDTMSEQIPDPARLQFSLVPFSSFVNVGAEHGPRFDKDGRQLPGTGAPWLDLDGRSTVPQTEIGVGVSRFQLYENLGQAWTGCVETRMRGNQDYDVSTAPANPNRPESLFVPAFAIDEPDGGGYFNSYIDSNVDPLDSSVGARKRKWAKYGVATDNRGEPLLKGVLNASVDLLGLANVKSLVIDTGPSGFQGFAKGPAFGCGTQALTPLTGDYGKLRNRVKALEARGTTNIMEGVAWGARVLTPGEPFAQAREQRSVGLEKIMVVLTDGSNVMGNSHTALRSTYSSFGFLIDGRLGIASGSAANTNALMNERTLAACDHAKAEGITVYTIRLEEPDTKTGTMLQTCATSPEHYFDAPSRAHLDDVFKAIRERVVRVRISS